MAISACQEGSTTPMRALIATVVAVGSADRLVEAEETLRTLGDVGTVRGILIAEGGDPAPPARVAGNTVTVHGLKPEYINNAVAALRLSSLPTLVWWRGGSPDMLRGLAALADRVVLDEPEPEAIWARAVTLFDDSAISDIRWARLTRWRALMAQFFDMSEVQAASSAFTRLRVRAGDRVSARLFAAWLSSSVRFDERFEVEIDDAGADAPIQAIRLGNPEQELILRLAGSPTCLETFASVDGERRASRVVSLGDQSLTGLMTEELRIRSRDTAFERALSSIVDDSPPAERQASRAARTPAAKPGASK
jgi:glucose-6-phosphate dehydrogenase assembly protein OpcA